MKQTSRYYLQHSGILGMKWGKRNGPPYPLKYEDLSEEERDNAKKKAVRAGNITEANNNIDFFDDHELKQLKDRFKLNQEVHSLAAETINTGAKRVDKTMKAIGKATDWAETGIKAYNTIAKVHNAFNNSKWTTITDKSNNDNNDNNNGGNKNNNNNNNNNNNGSKKNKNSGNNNNGGNSNNNNNNSNSNGGNRNNGDNKKSKNKN